MRRGLGDDLGGQVRAAVGRGARPPEAIVGDFLAALGWTGGGSRDSWWSVLRRRYPREALALQALLPTPDDEETEDTPEIFALKNSSLPFALEVTLGFQGPFYRQFAPWFIRWWRASGLPAPGRILDLGCDIGVLTCLYALLFPEARVEGIDAGAEGVDRARELADQIGIGNLTFRQADLRGPTALAEPGSVDLIVSTLALRAALGRAHWNGAALAERAWSVAEAMAGPASPQAVACLAGLRDLLVPGTGRLIAAERLLRTAELGRFARDAAAAGLVVVWRASTRELVKEPGGETELALLVLTPGAGQLTASPDDVLGFDAKDVVKSSARPGGRPIALVVEGAMAEALFLAHNPKTLLAGIEAIRHDGQSRHRREVWRCGPLVLAYEYSDRDDRSLQILPAGRGDELLAALEESARAVDANGEVDIRRYSD